MARPIRVKVRRTLMIAKLRAKLDKLTSKGGEYDKELAAALGAHKAEFKAWATDAIKNIGVWSKTVAEAKALDELTKLGSNPFHIGYAPSAAYAMPNRADARYISRIESAVKALEAAVDETVTVSIEDDLFSLINN